MHDDKQKIKILRIITRMNVGGPSKHVTNLSASLSEHGYQTKLLSGIPNDNEGNMFNLAHQKNIDLKIIRHLGRSISPLDDFVAFIEIIKEIKSFKPDIVHTHTTKAGILGRAAALICGVPQIYHTFHGHIFKGYFSQFLTSIIILIERIFAKFTTALITLTPNQAAEIQKILRIKDKSKIKIIPLGLDLKLNYLTPRKQETWRISQGFSPNDFLIGIVARLVPIKNHSMLINAMSELVKQVSNLHLVIIGTGELENQLIAQVKKLKLTNSIHFIGNQSCMENIYSDLDLLVLSSKNEGTPVVILEALASGCPVAATNVGGISEILHGYQSAFLLPNQPNTFNNELLKIILRIRENKLNTCCLDRNKTVNDYSVEKLTQNIIDLYKFKC